MTIFQTLKKRFYFVVARYFRFFANISLRRWHPRIIAITGSAGKTTMLSLVEFQLGQKAHYSHDANSAFGISFDILGLKGVKGHKIRWLFLFLAAPVKSLYFRHREPLYVVEIDGERPHETEFLANWLHPELTLWISLGRSHAIQFDPLVASGAFSTVDDAIAAEFATLAKATKKHVYIDADNPLMVHASEGISAEVVPFKKSDVKRYIVYPDATDFSFGATTFHFASPQPRDLAIQLLMLRHLCTYLKIPLKTDLSTLPLAPGRSSYFHGKNGLDLIDSTYNAHLISMASILDMARSLHAPHKWLVIGDIVDQGSIEKEEHTKLADLIASVDAEEVILVGRRTKAYTAPRLKELGISAKTTLDPKKALQYIQKATRGRETIIFKGSQYLEWIIEQLLEDPADARFLPRRDSGAKKRRERYGLK